MPTLTTENTHLNLWSKNGPTVAIGAAVVSHRPSLQQLQDTKGIVFAARVGNRVAD